jgi:GTP-binding protein HflX
MAELAEHDPGPTHAILLGVQLESETAEERGESLAELGRLAETLGHRVAGRLTQRRHSFDPAAYLGPGKVAELPALVAQATAQGGRAVVLVDDEITPSQARHLEKAAGAPVLDRTAVILEIFHRHARSRQARAQVEMVRLQYLAPRLREQAAMNKGDRQRGGGGAGTRGPGETQVELDRRKIRDRIAELKREIEKIADERSTQRARRGDQQRVALVGYTNAGKSTLMRGLTASDVLVADQLFATLDTTVRALQPPAHPPILVSDTVGFIRHLPHGLVASFKSTLDEALEADLLVQVIDASDPAHPRQIEATEAVLDEIGARELPRLRVYNKADRLPDPAAFVAEGGAGLLAPLVLSAKRPEEVAALRARLVAFFEQGMVEADLLVGYDRSALRAEVWKHCRVIDERADQEGVTFRARGRPEEIERLRALCRAP